jgi:oligoribonuclease NrnB/cAMP/cGMP phosphodiesterase (DHH superfamily)
MDKSGAALAWEAFHGSDLPPLIQYVQDRDLWRFALPNSREVSAWLRSHTLDFVLWNFLAEKLRTKFDVVVAEGSAILRMQSQMVAQMADRARWEEIGGHRVPIANATAFFSEVGEELCLRHPKAPFSAYYLVRADGLCQLGLRSRGEFDVSLIAKQYGGGGHRNAAGFVAGLSSAVNVPDPRTPA